MKRTILIAFGTASLAVCLGVPTAEAESDSLAYAFGRIPQMWGARLSPDGSRISFLHMEDNLDIPAAFVLYPDGSNNLILASKPDEFDIKWCNWANSDRLLCGFSGATSARGSLFPATRLVAIDHDGDNMKVLLQRKLRGEFTQFQDRIVDWLPDDPQHVLVAMPRYDGMGVSVLNIYDGKTSTKNKIRKSAREWITDGHGEVRLRHDVSATNSKWSYRLAGQEKWQLLHESRMEDIDDTWLPIGFGSDRNVLMVLKPADGRLALWQKDLTEDQPDRIVFSHPEVDVGSALSFGKYKRLVAIGYSTDKPNFHYFDNKVERIIESLQQALPGQLIGIVDESWDQRFYLVNASSDVEPGRYYRLDSSKWTLQAFWPLRPELEGRALAAMAPVRYPARDGIEIPGYLTVPPASDGRRLPAVILPHDGPRSRDEWDFDWMVQFLAAKGYAVLQSNYRGSGGYGEAWSGEGGYRAWRLAIADIVDGAKWLIDENVADPDRLCIVGWGYGGYAALMSSIEEPDLFRCVVSIAGVTDLSTLRSDARRFVNRKAVAEFVGREKEVINDGSPLNRANELRAPVQLFHGDRDFNVTVKHSKKMNKALTKVKVRNEITLYESAGHDIWRNRYRVDMLEKLGSFLDESIGNASVDDNRTGAD